MTLNEQVFTLSKYKRPDCEGTVAQLFGKPVYDTLLKRIDNGVVAAVCFVNQNAELQYIFCPQVYYDIDGEPAKIVGNVSNNKGSYALVEIDLRASLTYFHSVYLANSAQDQLKGPKTLPAG